MYYCSLVMDEWGLGWVTAKGGQSMGEVTGLFDLGRL